MTRIVVIVILFLAISSLTLAGIEDQQDLSFINPGVTVTTNIHFNKLYCTECHVQKPKGDERIPLRHENYTLACRCHGYTPDTYTHPVETKLSAEKRSTIPAEFPLSNNTITCNTCHFMALQCKPQYEFRHSNKAFLRTNPVLGRTVLCFKCHKQEQYKMYDPHKQLDKAGKVIEETCLYCHEIRLNEQEVTLAQAEKVGQSVRLVGDFEVICLRCHNNKVGLHPLNKDHLIKPSEKVLKRMHWSERNLWIVLPLNEEGKITCITCHNPHERGVIPEEKAASAGASEKGRLRKAWGGGSICVACHKM